MIDGSNVNVGCTLLSWCNQGNLEGNGGGQWRLQESSDSRPQYFELIGHSREHALVLKNIKIKENLCGLDLIAQCMKHFPMERTCGSAHLAKNRVHYYAVNLLGRIAHHKDLREHVIASGCAESKSWFVFRRLARRSTIHTMGLIYNYKVDNSGRKYERSCSCSA
jgi:hypothetical protein